MESNNYIAFHSNADLLLTGVKRKFKNYIIIDKGREM